MWIPILAFVMLLTSSASSLGGLQPLRDCKWLVGNVSDVASLPRHHYRLLEDCLYYSLSDAADEAAGRPGALASEPPSPEAVRFRLANLSLSSAYMPSEVYRDLYLSGTLQWSWTDPRLVWDAQQWKTAKAQIHFQEHIWIPDLSDASPDGASFARAGASPSALLFRDIWASASGELSAEAVFSLRAHCTLDFADFPSDEKRCCARLRSRLYPALPRFSVRPEAFRHPEFQSVWAVSDVALRSAGKSGSELELCLSAKRQSRTLRLELSLPLAVAASLLLLAPLFPSPGQQQGVRLLSLSLQVFCFQYLVAATPQLGFGDSVPRLYLFYAFSLLLSLLWLLLGLLCSLAAHRRWALPPPHALFLFATAANKALCTARQRPAATDSAPANQERAAEDWAAVFPAANRLVALLLSLVYIIGAFALAV